MDITALRNMGTRDIIDFAKNSAVASPERDQSFDSVLGQAVESLRTTNGYMKDAEEKEIQLSLGQLENTHDLTTAISKAETALQFTVAVRDKMMEAYKEIMQIQM